MKVSISIPDKMLEAVDNIADEYGKDKRSMVIQLAIKDYLMKHNYTEKHEQHSDKEYCVVCMPLMGRMNRDEEQEP